MSQYRLMKEFHHLECPADKCVGVPAHCFDDLVKDVVATQEGKDSKVNTHTHTSSLIAMHEAQQNHVPSVCKLCTCVCLCTGNTNASRE